MNLTTLDRLTNKFSSEKNKIKMRCKYCDQGIFNLNTPWAKTGQCIHCWEGENRGRKLQHKGLKEKDRR